MAKINFPKKQEQRLIPKYLLEYTEELVENHPDPTDPWGGGDANIEAGTGITITTESDDTKTISIDDTVVATKDEIPDSVSGTNDGTNWTSLTIGNDTYDIPQGGGSTYTAGTGIDITNDVISVDNTVAMKTDLPDVTHMVTDNTNQNITGIKTFKGEDKLVLQGTTASQKPGFAILDGNDDKRGFLELRPGTGDKTMVLGVYNKNNYTDTSTYRIGLREYNQSNGNYTYSTLMPKGSDKYTTFGSGNMNMVLGVNGQKADDSGNVSLSIPSKTSDLTNDSGYITGINSSDVITALGYTPGTSNFSGSYNDLTNKPTIPTVNNKTITIQKNETTVDSFTLNQSTNKTINISVPTATSDLTNDSGFVTSSDLSDYVTEDEFIFNASSFSDGDTLTEQEALDALNSMHIKYNNKIYTKISDTSISSSVKTWNYCYLANLATGKYANEYIINISTSSPYTIHISNESYKIPEATSDLTNDSGYITAAQVPAGWEVVDVYQSQSSTPVSAADLVKLAGDNVCIRYNLDSGAFPSGTYSLFYKKESPALSGYYIFDNLDLKYQTGTSYIGFGKIIVDPTDGSWSYGTDYRVYAGHKIEAGSGLVEGSTTTSYGKTLEIDTTTVALKSELFSGSYTDLTNKPDLSIYAQSANLATVATSGSYNDLSNKPTIPTVNDNTITITQGGVTKGSFTLNQNTNQTIDVDDVPGMIGEVLYETTPTSGTTKISSITLSQDYRTYAELHVYFNTNDSVDYKNAIVVCPNNSKVNVELLQAHPTNSTAYLKCTRLDGDDTTGTTFTQITDGQLSNGTWTATNDQTHCRIYKIIGYKQNSAPIVIPDFEYHSGNKFTNSNYMSSTGYISSAQKELTFTIVLPKLMTNITSVTVDKLECLLRGVGGYVNGSANMNYVGQSGYTINTYIGAPNMLTISIIKSTAYSSATNNTPVNVAFTVGGLELTFNQ